MNKTESRGRKGGEKFRVLIADDHVLMKQSLRSLIDLLPDCVVVAEASNGEEAVLLAGQIEPDIILMDVRMPKMDGIEAARQILVSQPGVKLLGLSAHEDRRYAATMIGLGASGYLVKDHLSTELYLAIKTVLEGKKYLSPGIFAPAG